MVEHNADQGFVLFGTFILDDRVAELTAQLLGTLIVATGVEVGGDGRILITPEVIDPPAGQYPGNLADVVFGVVDVAGLALLYGEEFEQLAGVVFIRGILVVVPAVEKLQHRRVHGNLLDQGAEVAGSQPTE